MYVFVFYTCISALFNVQIVMEYMDRGSLAEILSCDHPIPEQHIAYVCRCLLSALDALHSQNRIHRGIYKAFYFHIYHNHHNHNHHHHHHPHSIDIKSDNILLDSQGHVKLADFGFAVYLQENTQRKSVVGTPFWMAPELIHGKGYGMAVDVWSAGITALEMAEGEPPFYHDPPIKALLNIHTGPAPELKTPSQWSNKFRSFLRLVLEKDVSKRATVKELLMHPFMQEASTPEVFASFLNSALARNKRVNA